eukprot:scaffold39012_cov191-Amphora_coffeaeformis.AAC.4
MDLDWDQSNLLALLQAESPRWDAIAERMFDKPEEAFLVDPTTGLSALHFAVTKRKTASDPSRVVAVVKGIGKANPMAAASKCLPQGFTPLAYCCHSQSLDPDDLAWDAEIATALCECNPDAIKVQSKKRLFPLAIHIAAVSRLRFRTLHHHDKSSSSTSKSFSSPVFDLLLEHSEKEHMEQAIHVLFACNTGDVMHHVSVGEIWARKKLPPRDLGGWFVWDVMCRVLRAYHYYLHAGRHVTFNTLHTLTMVTDCPPAFLLLGMYSAPSDVLLKEASAGNLPIHNVASWELDDEEESICRKSMSWATLMAACPESVDVKNDFGETA